MTSIQASEALTRADRDRLLEDQRERWERHSPILVEAYLDRHPNLRHDREALLDLLYQEYRLRQESGESPALEEFVGRFPELALELREQFQVHKAVVEFLHTQSEPTVIPDQGQCPLPPVGWPDIPGYQILGKLGQGGMAIVYRARQTKLDRVVALKMILSHGRPGEFRPERMKVEAEVIAQLQHPNIVQIFDVGECGGLPYLALEFCSGGTLDDRLEGTPLPPDQAARLVQILAGAMEAAHKKGIVHRDLKPANILLGGETPGHEVGASEAGGLKLVDGWVPKISDFGLAKKLDTAGLTREGIFAGTPSYASPEQIQGLATLGQTSDIYSLGAILYELLTGRPPFQAATAIETLRQVLTEDPVPPTRLQSRTPRDLETICLKCLHFEPARRYATAGELAQDLNRFLEGLPVHARPIGWHVRLKKWARRRPALASLLVALAITLLVGAGLLWHLVEERIGRVQAQSEKTTLQHVVRIVHHAGKQKEIEYAVRDQQFLPMRDLLDRSKTLVESEEGYPFEWHYWNNYYHQEMAAFEGKGFVDVAPDGTTYLTAGRNNTIRLVDSLDHRDVRSLSGLEAEPKGAVFSQSGKVVGAISKDGKVAFWDAGTGLLLGPPSPGHEGPFFHISQGPRELFATTGDQVIKIWDPVGKAAQVRLEKKAQAKGLRSTAFDPRGTYLVGEQTDNTIAVWDLQRAAWVRDLERGIAEISRIAFSPVPEQQLLVIARSDPGKTLELIDTATWKKRDSLTGSPTMVRALAFSMNGDRLAVARGNCTIEIWNPRERQRLGVIPGHTQTIRCLAFCRGLERASVLSSVAEDGMVKIWDVAKPRLPELRVGGHNAPVRALAYSPDGTLLASGAGDHSVCLRVARGPHAIGVFRLANPVAALGFAPDGQTLFACGTNRDEDPPNADVWEWDVRKQKGRRILESQQLPASAVTIAGPRLILGKTTGAIDFFDARTGTRMRTSMEGKQKVTHLAMSGDGSSLATIRVTRNLLAWKWPSMHREMLRLNSRCDFVSLALSRDGSRVAAGCEDGTILLGSIGSEPGIREIVGHEGKVNGLAFSPDGHRLASAGQDQTVRVWDTFAGSELLRLKVDWSNVSTVVFHPAGDRLAAGGGSNNKGEILIWDGRARQVP